MAPKGNQNAKGHGRPANEGFSNPQIKKLGQELLDWLKIREDSGDFVIHLSEWYSRIKQIPRSQWISICARSCFIDYYARALEWVGVMIMKNPELDRSYGNRFLGVYFKDLRDHERDIIHDKIDYELTRKLEIDKSRSEHPNDDKLDELIRAVKAKK